MPVSPSLSTVVTSVLDGAWPEVERHTRLAANGLRLIPAPARAGEATVALSQSTRSLVPMLAMLRSPIVVADAGRVGPAPLDHPFVAAAAVNVVVHRQSTQSARAAAVRLQRLVDRLEQFAAAPVVVAVVGTDPYGADEVRQFVRDGVGDTAVVALPVDDLAAAVLGGRTGVSERRLARLPLMRGARGLAHEVSRVLAHSTDGLWRSAR
jgi:hypothetical protein